MIPVQDQAYVNPVDLLLDETKVLGTDAMLKEGDVGRKSHSWRLKCVNWSDKPRCTGV